jgi:hypothetical protein
MIIMRLVAAGLLGMVGVSALAQAPVVDMADGVRAGLWHGARDSLPRSIRAINIVPADTTATSAPILPEPGLSLDVPWRDYLRAARTSLAAGHAGKAQQSLEMAETRVLGGSDSPDQANLPSGSPWITKIREALYALGNGNTAHAMQIIDAVLAN